MASRFATVSKDKILAVNEAAALANTRRRQNLACRCQYWPVQRNFLNAFATKS